MEKVVNENREEFEKKRDAAAKEENNTDQQAKS